MCTEVSTDAFINFNAAGGMARFTELVSKHEPLRKLFKSPIFREDGAAALAAGSNIIPSTLRLGAFHEWLLKVRARLVAAHARRIP